MAEEAMNIFRSTWLLILLALALALSVPAATEATQPAVAALAANATHCPTAARETKTEIQSPLDEWISGTACHPSIATLLIDHDRQRSTQGAGLDSSTRLAEMRE